jgi:23S rRNA pseudouridine2457 synthase
LPKVYLAQVEGAPSAAALERLRHGVHIKGRVTQPCQARVVDAEPELPPRTKPVTPHGPTAWLELILTEGKKRQVRHMTAAVGLPTLRLVRVAIGPVRLHDLQPGQWRDLSRAELDSIIRRRAHPPTRRPAQSSTHRKQSARRSDPRRKDRTR